MSTAVPRASGTFARQLGALDAVFGLIETFVAPIGASERACYALQLAVEEIFVNMVEHNAEGSGEIRIDAGVVGGEIAVRITDCDSPPFDLTIEAPDVDTSAPLAERTPGGLGIHLVKKLVDRIEYDHHGRTCTITLHKRMD